MIECSFKLEDTGRTVEVAGLCCGLGTQSVHRCGANGGECIDAGIYPGIQACSQCEIPNRPPNFPVVKPVFYAPIKFPPQAAQAGTYNCSIHGDDKAGFAFAFRSSWTSSEIRLCRLSESGRPIGVMMPGFTLHARAPRGREDPRLFRFQGRWHFSYTGYESSDGIFSSVLVAEVDPWPMVAKAWSPRYDQRDPKAEKNWGFFEHAGRLHCVYRIGPGEHRVLKFDGDAVCDVFSAQWVPGWGWGHMRGGASPQMHNGEWYSWFHGFRQEGGYIVYTMGLYTFEDRPPFRPLRRIRKPIVIAGRSHIDNGWRKHVYYPCGAAFKNGRWWISAGEHDNRCTIAAFDAAEVEKELKPWA